MQALDVIAKYLLDTLIRNVNAVTISDKYDEALLVEYKTGSVEYFDPKDGKTIQHGLMIQGTVTVVSDKIRIGLLFLWTKYPTCCLLQLPKA